MLFKGQNNWSQSICRRAEGILDYFGRHGISSVDCNLSSDRHESVKWEPLSTVWMKLNVDAAVGANKDVVGYVVVVRNHHGLVMAAGMAQGVFSDDVDLAEAEALCFGLQMAKEIGLSPLIIEYDSLHVTQFVSDRLSTRTELFWLISKAKNLLSPKHKFQVRTFSRVCNTAADALAKYYICCRKYYAWVDDFPPHLCCYL